MSLNVSSSLLRLMTLCSSMNMTVYDMPAKTRNEISFCILLKLMEHDITFPKIFSVYKTDQIAVKAVINIVSL